MASTESLPLQKQDIMVINTTRILSLQKENKTSIEYRTGMVRCHLNFPPVTTIADQDDILVFFSCNDG